MKTCGTVWTFYRTYAMKIPLRFLRMLCKYHCFSYVMNLFDEWIVHCFSIDSTK
jgi:hypothetical protein